VHDKVEKKKEEVVKNKNALKKIIAYPTTEKILLTLLSIIKTF